MAVHQDILLPTGAAQQSTKPHLKLPLWQRDEKEVWHKASNDVVTQWKVARPDVHYIYNIHIIHIVYYYTLHFFVILKIGHRSDNS